jgi:hypothetical protein
MSDYEVSLVNDSMQEFYVRFYGPTESKHLPFIYRYNLRNLVLTCPLFLHTICAAPISALCRRSVEDPR